MKSKLLLITFFLCSVLLHAQQDQVPILKGKISSDISQLDGVYVIKVGTDDSAVTDSGGYFKISAMAGDTLMFSSTSIIGKRIVVTAEDIKQELVIFRLEMRPNLIDEVVVNRTINAASLGLVPADQKKYTPAERKLNTASNAYASVGLASSVSLDPVLNWMSGRTAMLKKELEVERKEGWLEQLSSLYSKEYLEKLKIPVDYIEGFFRYCVEDKTFLSTLKAGNKTLAAFQLTELAIKYNEIVSLENK